MSNSQKNVCKLFVKMSKLLVLSCYHNFTSLFLFMIVNGLDF